MLVSEVLFVSARSLPESLVGVSAGVVKVLGSAITGLNVVVISKFLFALNRRLDILDLESFVAVGFWCFVESVLVPFVPLTLMPSK